MSGDTLRQAAAALRADYSDPIEGRFENAVAAWLDAKATDWTPVGVENQCAEEVASAVLAMLELPNDHKGESDRAVTFNDPFEFNAITGRRRVRVNDTRTSGAGPVRFRPLVHSHEAWDECPDDCPGRGA